MREKIQAQLEKYGQMHLLQYYDRITAKQQNYLEDQLEHMDWNILQTFDEVKKESPRGKITPIGALSIPDIDKDREEYISTGLEAIRAGKIGALLLAGGQGTRLGWDGPKGTYNIGEIKDLYIFEQLFANTLKIVRMADAWIPFFIMTSEKNHEATVRFIKEKNYFGYDPEYVFFFTQDMAPCLDFDKKLLMESMDRIATSPNGNGGWFTSLVKAGLMEKVKAFGIEWLNCFAVDNVLQQIADPCFIGAVLKNKYVCGSKVVRKADPEEKVGVMCLEDQKPSIIEYYEMTEEMRYQKNGKGEYAYNFGVILNYLFRIDKLLEIMERNMPAHGAAKKIPFMDPEGVYHQPEEPNGYKFEKFILDMVHMMDNCLVFEVDREKEFAPIKNKSGRDSVDSARELLRKNGIEY